MRTLLHSVSSLVCNKFFAQSRSIKIPFKSPPPPKKKKNLFSLPKICKEMFDARTKSISHKWWHLFLKLACFCQLQIQSLPPIQKYVCACLSDTPTKLCQCA